MVLGMETVGGARVNDAMKGEEGHHSNGIGALIRGTGMAPTQTQNIRAPDLDFPSLLFLWHAPLSLWPQHPHLTKTTGLEQGFLLINTTSF